LFCRVFFYIFAHETAYIKAWEDDFGKKYFQGKPKERNEHNHFIPSPYKVVTEYENEFIKAWNDTMAEAFVEVLKYIAKETKQATIKKSESVDIEKARSGVYKDNDENRKLNRVGQRYGGDADKKLELIKQHLSEKTDEELRDIISNKKGVTALIYYAKQELEQREDRKEANDFEIDITENIKQCLENKKNRIKKDPLASKNDDKEVEKIIEVIKTLEDEKIEFKAKGRFEIKKATEGEGRGRKKIRWESLYDTGKVDSAIKEFSGCNAENELQEVFIRAIAQKQGLLISKEEREKWDEVLAQGEESLVYKDPDNKGTKVIKTTDYTKVNDDDNKKIIYFSDFAERMIGFNEMFPETAYDLIGFTEQEEMKEDGTYKRIMLKPVLRQNSVEGKVLAKFENPEKEIAEAMKYFKSIGYVVTRHRTLQKNGWEASDLHKGNIIKTPGGKYYIIDAYVKRIEKSESVDIEKARKLYEGFVDKDGYVWTKREDGTFGWRKPKKSIKEIVNDLPSVVRRKLSSRMRSEYGTNVGFEDLCATGEASKNVEKFVKQQIKELSEFIDTDIEKARLEGTLSTDGTKMWKKRKSGIGGYWINNLTKDKQNGRDTNIKSRHDKGAAGRKIRGIEGAIQRGKQDKFYSKATQIRSIYSNVSNILDTFSSSTDLYPFGIDIQKLPFDKVSPVTKLGTLKDQPGYYEAKGKKQVGKKKEWVRYEVSVEKREQAAAQIEDFFKKSKFWKKFDAEGADFIVTARSLEQGSLNLIPEALSNAASEKLKISPIQASLSNKKSESTGKGLSAKIENTAKFKIDGDLTGKKVIVCDDVYTTGKTMMALMKAVEDAGGTVVKAITAGTGMLGGSIKPDKGDIDKFLNKLDLTKDEFEELLGFQPAG
jgi:hypothetical protein